MGGTLCGFLPPKIHFVNIDVLFAQLLAKIFLHLSGDNNIWLSIFQAAFVFFSLDLRGPATIRACISYTCFVLGASVNLKVLFALADKGIKAYIQSPGTRSPSAALGIGLTSAAYILPSGTGAIVTAYMRLSGTRSSLTAYTALIFSKFSIYKPHAYVNDLY